MPRSMPMLGRGSMRRPATISPSAWRLSSISTYWRSRSGSSRVSHMKTEICPAPSAFSAPSMTGMLNRPKLSVVITPTVYVRPTSSPRASMFGAKPSSWAAAATLSLVSERSLPWPFRAFDAVPIETSASAATSRMVTRLDSDPRCGKPLCPEPLCSEPLCSEPLCSKPLGGKRLLHHFYRPTVGRSVVKMQLYRLDALHHESYLAGKRVSSYPIDLSQPCRKAEQHR